MESMETGDLNEPQLTLDVCYEEVKRFDETLILKDDQKSVINALCSEKDCYCVLPTGSGKSIIFISYVLGARRIYEKTLCVVVSPLVSLNKSHTEAFDQYNLKYWNMNEGSIQPHNTNELDIIIASPELLHDLRASLKQFAYLKSIFVVDEAHTILSWGDRFRPLFTELDKTISLFKKKPVILTLSATMTTWSKVKLFDKLGLKDSEVFQLVRNPVAANMSFISVKDKFTRRTAKSLKDMLRNHGIDSPKCVIFTTTISETLAVKDMILDELEPELTKFVNWCTAANSKSMKDGVVAGLLHDKSGTRILVTTSLLSMGIDTKGVRYVMMTAMTQDVEGYLQRAGRGGRDGKDCYSILFAGVPSKKCSSNAEQIRTNSENSCLRVILGRPFQGQTLPYSGEDICCSSCPGVSQDPLVSRLMEETLPIKTAVLFPEGHKKRRITRADRELFGVSLRELRETLSQKLYSRMYIAPCHLTDGTITHLRQNAHFLFTIDDVREIVGDRYTAQVVLEEVADFFEDFEVTTHQQPPPSLSDLDSFWDHGTPLSSLNDESSAMQTGE